MLQGGGMLTKVLRRNEYRLKPQTCPHLGRVKGGGEVSKANNVWKVGRDHLLMLGGHFFPLPSNGWDVNRTGNRMDISESSVRIKIMQDTIEGRAQPFRLQRRSLEAAGRWHSLGLRRLCQGGYGDCEADRSVRNPCPCNSNRLCENVAQI